METQHKLDQWLEEVTACAAEEFVPLSGRIARDMASLPAEDAETIRNWVARLYASVQQGERGFDVLAPFVQGLAARHEMSAAELLGKIMLDETVYLTEDIVDLLDEMGSAARPAIPHLTQVLASADEAWPRAKAAHALGRTGDVRVADALQRALDDPEGIVRNAALDSMLQVDRPLPFDRLRTIVGEDPDSLVRAAAIRGLGRWYPVEAEPVLRRLATAEDNPDILRALQQALGESKA